MRQQYFLNDNRLHRPGIAQLRTFAAEHNKPSRIIMDCSRQAKFMWQRIASLPVARSQLFLDLFTEDDIGQKIFQALIYEHNAEENLGFMGLTMVDDIGYCDRSLVDRGCWHELERDLAHVANAMHEFGMQAFHQLKHVRAYESGYLHYLFGGWADYEIVLRRLDVPPVNGVSPDSNEHL